jgi:hypothetical protein
MKNFKFILIQSELNKTLIEYIHVYIKQWINLHVLILFEIVDSWLPGVVQVNWITHNGELSKSVCTSHGV